MNTVNEEVKPADAKPESEKLFHYCEVFKVPRMSSIRPQWHYHGAKHRKANYANCLRPLMSISRDEFPSGESIQKHYKLYGKSKEFNIQTLVNVLVGTREKD